MKIVAPEGYEIDKENSTFECIKFKPIEKAKTYEDVAEKLFLNKGIFFIDISGNIDYYKCNLLSNYKYPNNCTSEKQAKKLIAINKLMNVAKYLNSDWKPDWCNVDEEKYFIYHCKRDSYISVKSATIHISDIVYFKSEDLARQAIEILGEDTIKLALSTDW